jgi:hypothetical protein
VHAVEDVQKGLAGACGREMVRERGEKRIERVGIARSP